MHDFALDFLKWMRVWIFASVHLCNKLKMKISFANRRKPKKGNIVCSIQSICRRYAFSSRRCPTFCTTSRRQWKLWKENITCANVIATGIRLPHLLFKRIAMHHTPRQQRRWQFSFFAILFSFFFFSLDSMKGRTFIWSLWHDLLSLSLLCILSSLSTCIHLLPRKRCIVLRNETKVYIEDFGSSTVQRDAFYTPLIKNSSHTVCKIQDSDSLQYSQLYLLIVGRQSEGKIIILSVCEKGHIGELKFFPGRRVVLVYSLIIYKMKLNDKRKWFRLPDRVFFTK